MRFLVTTKCRANGRHVAAGEILDESNSDISTLKALHDGGRGRYVADDYKAEAPAVPKAPAEPEAPAVPVIDEASEPDTEPAKKRGRPRKES